MARVRVSTVIDAPPERVWEEVADISRHPQWMDDAVALRFTGPATSGVGTTFECDTRLGPLRLTDHMVVIEWRPPRSMGIAHTGLVTGMGRFLLHPSREGGTRFVWDERLHFPLWMGGILGSVAARPLLRRVWRRNLTNLKRRIEVGAG